MDQHQLVCALKELAIELGRTPTRDEFKKSGLGPEHVVRKLFGTHAALVQASGLEAVRGARKIDSSVFNRGLEKHLEEYEPRPVSERKPYPSIAVISDIHFPFENQAVLDAFYSYLAKHHPEYVILNGDAWDMYAHSRFPKSLNTFSPREERDLSKRANETFWKECIKASPDSKRYQMLGNHSARPMKQILEVYPEAEDWIAEGLKRDLTFEKVTTVFDTREELMIGDIMVHHGYRSKLGDHRDYTHMNSIVGHTHKGGVVFRQIRGQVLWELNSGFAGNPDGKGLTYTPQKIIDWTPGFGAVDEYGPRFIHL